MVRLPALTGATAGCAAGAAATMRRAGAGAGRWAWLPATGTSTQRFSPLAQVCTTGKKMRPAAASEASIWPTKTNSSSCSFGSEPPDQEISVTPSRTSRPWLT